MRFGLSDSAVEKIHQVFQRFVHVDRVTIFGSRAKGNFKEGSDVDLSLQGKDLDFEDIVNLQSKLEDLNLPYKIDLIQYDSIENKDVKDHINRVWKNILQSDLISP